MKVPHKFLPMVRVLRFKTLTACICLLLYAHAQAAPILLSKNGKTDFTIIVTNNADSLEVLAANELQQYLFQITGAKFPLIRSNNAAHLSASFIFIGKASPKSLAGNNQYVIKTEPNKLHIAGSTPWKTLEAVYLFLEQYAGCHFLSPAAEWVPKKSNLLVEANYSHSPIIDTRTVHSKLFFNNHLFAAKRRVSTVTFPGFVPGAGVHTFHKLVPASQWLKTNSEYFALVNGKRQATQLCLSNDTVYQLVVDSVKARFAQNPEAQLISISQDDNTSYCTCSRCAATDAYEQSAAGSMIRFVNRIAAKFPDNTISTLAYQYTRRAPKHIKPAANVLITLCSIECDRSAPIAKKCNDFERDLKEWKQTGATLKIWDYTTQFTNFLAPFPNLHSLQPNVQLFVENNTRWVFEQHSNNPSELFELRSYLLAQLLWNPYASYDSLSNIFLQHYYGKGAPFVKKYIDTLHADIQRDSSFFLFLYGDPSQGFKSFLREQRLTQFNAWFNEGERAVENKPEIKARLQAARIGVDYALLEYCRRSKGKYSLKSKILVEEMLNRFEKATQWLTAIHINEMGLQTTEYIAAYRQLTQNAILTNLAEGKSVKLFTQPKKYAAENPQTLTDGLFGGWSFYANWLGFEGNDLEAVVDLGESKTFNQVGVRFLQVSNHLVFFPQSVSFFGSDNGIDYKLIETVVNKWPLNKESRVNDIQLYATALKPMKSRYIKVVGNNMKKCPPWHHGAGLDAWIFADEIWITQK